MKKFLLTASMLVMGVVATFAQVPDASKWKVGDEITNDISWGNLSFESDPMDYWTLKADNATSPTTTGGAFEAYDNSGVDLYQYVQLPAGMYKVECQGYYRGGSSGPSDGVTSSKKGECAWFWLNDEWTDNALLSVYNGEYDKEKDVFTPNHQFKTPLMPRLFENQKELIHEDLHSGDDGYPGWDRFDYYYPELGIYGPTSFPGSYDWFQAGKYQPYDDGDTKYNTVTFFLTEDGYVKVGVVKKDKISQDTFFVTNFKMYYMGEAGEAAALMALQDDCNELITKLEAIKDNNTGFLAGKIEDELLLLYWGEDYGFGDDPYDWDKETATTAKAVLTEVFEGATAAQEDLAALNNAITAVASLVSTTDYQGKGALETALEAAKASISEDYIYEGEEDWDTYETLTEALYKARLDYMLTSPKGADGSYNFSAFITTPFFCDTEYTPVWDEEAQAYVYPTIDGVEDALQPDNTWATISEQGYSEAKADGSHADWIPICDNVSIGEKFVENQWVIKSTTWHGGGPVAVTMQHSYSAIGGWTQSPTGDPELLYQTITGLPNGFYGMSALMCNAGADISELQFAYIESGEAKATAPLTKPGNPWWGGDREAWRSGVWEKLTTDMIFVENGQVTIGTSSDAFYASTGFQLYYYGETPDFAALLKPSLDKAKEAAEALAWNGDKAASEAILAKVPATIADKEAYQAATEIINEANEYISKAKAAVDNWKGIQNFTALLGQYDEGSVESSIISTALNETLNVGDEDEGTWTYEDANTNNDQYNAYVTYLGYRESIGDFIKDPLVSPVIEEQNAYLTKNFATPEKLDEFKNAIGAPYNKAKFAAEGIDKATLTDPKEATFLLINPSFYEGPSKGWTVEGTGAATNDEFGNDWINETLTPTVAELWNRPVFTFSQTLNGLPAGTYEVRTHAMYRKAGGVDANALKSYLDQGGEEGRKDDLNTIFFAQGTDPMSRQTTYVKSIYSLEAHETSATQYIHAAEYDAEDGVSYPTEIYYIDGTISESEMTNPDIYKVKAETDDPFDAKVTITETDEESLEEVSTNYYFPKRTMGMFAACKKNYDAYLNSVIVYLPEGGALTFGIEKTAASGNDWVIMDDFQLFYLGTEAPTAIDEVAEDAAEGAVEYYSVNGVKLSAPQAGFNIVKYANGQVKKVFIK